MKAHLIFPILMIMISCGSHEIKTIHPATSRTSEIEEWESLRFGAFVHFNDNTFMGTEFSKNADPSVFNPSNLGIDQMFSGFHDAGVKYAVLTTRHTSGFCLWDSKTTEFDVASSPVKVDIVKQFVEACRKYDVKPCLYYCLWGGSWKPWEWNPFIKKELEGTTPKAILLSQLGELASDYGNIYSFWMDMHTWCDTSLSVREIYDFLKLKNKWTLVHFNQHVQDGSKIRYFPTDMLNGEERIPPSAGHNPYRMVDSVLYYLPFEYEITSQQCDQRSLGNGLMSGSTWFTYSDSRFYPVDSLYKYILKNFERGGSNILLSTAPDPSGHYRKADSDSLVKLGKLIWKQN